jgi:CheY-like chemotaxis protein
VIYLAPTSPAATSPAASQERRGTIPVIDDDTTARELIATYLAGEGFAVETAARQLLRAILGARGWSVREAANGRLALDAIRAELPDVVLLDLMMPEMDGFELVAALQANAAWRAIPVVVVTSLDLTAEDRRRLNGGVEQILSKHAFPPAELMASVGALLGETRKAPK